MSSFIGSDMSCEIRIFLDLQCVYLLQRGHIVSRIRLGHTCVSRSARWVSTVAFGVPGSERFGHALVGSPIVIVVGRIVGCGRHDSIVPHCSRLIRVTHGTLADSKPVLHYLAIVFCSGSVGSRMAILFEHAPQTTPVTQVESVAEAERLMRGISGVIVATARA
jgi:hypothetical protein